MQRASRRDDARVLMDRVLSSREIDNSVALLKFSHNLVVVVIVVVVVVVTGG